MPFYRPPATDDSAGPKAWQLAVLLAAIALIRIVALKFNVTDLFFDEAQYWSWGKEPAFGYYSKPPLVGWIIGATTALCGDSTFCVRLPSAVLHTATAAVIYLTGLRLAGPKVGFWSALTFATLPGISLSAAIISTDVPLLLAWAVALWALVGLLETRGWAPAIALGLAIGVGLNAKYAMAFFVVSLVIAMALIPSVKALRSDARLWVALAIGVALILPNMAWNLSHKFATFAHTADNAKWGGTLLNAGKGLEFAASQLGVFGPILFVALIALLHRAWREGLPEHEKLLLCFTLPVLAMITAQAFVSRAHANWAAVSYVAGTILVVSALVRLARDRLLVASLALHTAVLGLVSVGMALAGTFTLPVVGDPFQRLLGWKEIAHAAAKELASARAAGRPYRAVMADDRSITAELLYYMPDEPTPIIAWRENGRPRDHYELTRPFKDPAQVPILLVSIKRDPAAITSRFKTTSTVADLAIPAGKGDPRRVRLIQLSNLKKTE